MSRRQAIAVLVFAFVSLAFVARDAGAQKVYKWKDKEGKIHFSNVAPANEAASDEGSGVKGIEAQSPDTAAAPAPAEPPAAASEEAPAAPREPSAPAVASGAGLSDEGFSARVSATRLRLKRELGIAKAEWAEASEKLDALKKERDQPVRVGLEMLQKAYGPDAHASSDEEDLRKRKQKAEKRMEEMRKQYADLREEAMKRYGHVPGWWLPIE
jgi:Domain of unknown function (DUF4124)